MGGGSCTRQHFAGAAVAIYLQPSLVEAQELARETAAAATAPSSESAVPESAAPSAQELEPARLAFWQAHERFEAADYSAALELFEKSYALSPQPELVFNIALTHEQLGHCEQ